jgi:hypothetical protein
MVKLCIESEETYMPSLEDLELDLSAPVEIPHQFEIELNSTVVVNHKLIVDAIDRDEDAELEKLSFEDDEWARSIGSQIQNSYDDFRRAANNQAAVALVTRVQHWIARFAKRVPVAPKSKSKGSLLVSDLGHLNVFLGEGPVPVSFFAELVNVRDSVIHGDSKAEWDFEGKRRYVAAEYASVYLETEISNEQLSVAIAKAIEQVTWYDIKLQTAGRF